MSPSRPPAYDSVGAVPTPYAHVAALLREPSEPVRTVADPEAEVLASVRARIPDLERGTVLRVDVGSQAQAARIRAALLPHEIDSVIFTWPGQVTVQAGAA